jgi:hypothetical protein
MLCYVRIPTMMDHVDMILGINVDKNTQQSFVNPNFQQPEKMVVFLKTSDRQFKWMCLRTYGKGVDHIVFSRTLCGRRGPRPLWCFVVDPPFLGVPNVALYPLAHCVLTCYLRK